MKRLVTMLALSVALGCSAKKEQKQTEQATKPTKQEEHEPGPHKGFVDDLEGGNGLHFEFVVEPSKKEVRVYILDSKEKNEVAIKADKLMLNITKPMKFTIELKADKPDKDGKTTCFVANHENFKEKHKFTGDLTVTVENKPWTGDINEK